MDLVLDRGQRFAEPGGDASLDALQCVPPDLCQAHSSDPHRQEDLVQSSCTPPLFITGFTSGFAWQPGWLDAISGQAKVAAYRADQCAWFDRLFADTNTTERQVGAAKLEAAKQKMLEFTGANKMPWPQYYDGKWWKNDLAQKFGIEAIPAMVLIGPDGKVVSIEARGPELENQIKKLLAL